MRKPAAVLLGTVLLSTMLSGCAFGDYLAYAPCENYANELASAIEDAVGDYPEIGEIWADGAGVPLCRLTFTLDRALTSSDPERTTMSDAVEALRSGWEDEVVVTVVSGDGETFTFL